MNGERAIDWLQDRAGTERMITKTVDVKGEAFTFKHRPLTIIESQAAQKAAKSDDLNDFALQLLVQKALDENGRPLFQADAIMFLKRKVEKATVDALVMALLNQEEEEAPELDMKSPEAATSKGK